MWLVFAILTVLLWGTSDVIFKSVTNAGRANDLELLALNGTVYGVVCMIYWAVASVHISWEALLKYLPIAAIYILSMLFYYKMLPHIKISIASPIANTSCLLTTVLCVIILRQAINIIQSVAVLAIVVAIVVLSFDISEQSVGAGLGEYLVGVGFAVVYFVFDGVGSFLDDTILGDNDSEFAERVFGGTLSEDEAIIAYGIFYLAVGLAAMLVAARKRGEKRTLDFGFARDPRILAGCLVETAGQFTYIYTYAAGDAAIASPFIASFAMISVVLSHIFLKEKLRPKQYAAVALMLAGMFMISIE
jgi:drug/metabolite transporter (DMT)-like permease